MESPHSTLNDCYLHRPLWFKKPFLPLQIKKRNHREKMCLGIIYVYLLREQCLAALNGD